MKIFETNQSIERPTCSTLCAQLWSEALLARECARAEARMIHALEATLETDSARRVNPKTARLRERRRASLRAEIARRTRDRSALARRGVVAAWLAFERGAAGALETELHGGFFAELELALRTAHLPPIDREHAVWRRLEATQARSEHFAAHARDVCEPVATDVEVDEAIACVRGALRELHVQLARAAPAWVDADEADDAPDPPTATRPARHEATALYSAL